MNTNNILLKKVSESILLEEEEVSIFSFTLSDYQTLVPGDYVYDIVIDTDTGAQFTLIDRAYFSVIKSSSGSPDFETSRLLSLNSRGFYLSNTPMVCKFNHRRINRTDAEGTLILFNRIKPPNISESDDDNSLILFSQRSEGDDGENTLIIF